MTTRAQQLWSQLTLHHALSFFAAGLVTPFMIAVARTAEWPGAYLVGAMQMAFFISVFLGLASTEHGTQLIEERRRMLKNAHVAPRERWLVPLLLFVTALLYPAAGLQRRFHHAPALRPAPPPAPPASVLQSLLQSAARGAIATASPLLPNSFKPAPTPPPAQPPPPPPLLSPAGAQQHVLLIVAAAVLAAAHALQCWTILTNRWFSSVVRVQAERGHQVCCTGPYAYVRHAGYLAWTLQSFAESVLLGSSWAAGVAAARTALLVARTVWEEEWLVGRLTGYKQYTARVRYRWVPWVW